MGAVLSCRTKIPVDIIHRTKSKPLASVHGCHIVKLCGQIAIKYHRKGNNSVILKDKNSKKKITLFAYDYNTPKFGYGFVYIMVLL